MTWGADTYELDRALSLAKYAGDAAEVARLEAALAAARAACVHDPNPECPSRCWRCGAPTSPGLCSTHAAPPARARTSPRRKSA